VTKQHHELGQSVYLLLFSLPCWGPKVALFHGNAEGIQDNRLGECITSGTFQTRQYLLDSSLLFGRHIND